MASIKLKRSATPSKVPTTTDLDLGEVAINTYDGKMYIKKDDGVEAVVEIGAGDYLTSSDIGTTVQAYDATILNDSDISVSVQPYNANTVIDSSYIHTDNNYTTTEKNKLDGIAAGAEVNVNADWDALSGDAQILNKPTLGTAASTDSTAYATAAQGSLADSAVQPGDNVSDLTNDAGYLTSESDPVFAAWDKSTGISITESQISDFGNYEPADTTILKDADIGVTVQAYDADLTSWAAIAPSAKQDTLVSGTSIKTVNSTSLLGSGDLVVSGGISYTRHTSNVTVADKDGIIADTSGGTFTVTLPATPTTGYQVYIVDGAAWGTNNLIVGRNGSTIGNAAEDLTLDISGAAVQLIYDGTTWEVYAQIGASGGSAVTLTGTQTLTNKTIEAASLTNGYTEEVYELGTTGSLALNPANGSIQTCALTGDPTFTDSLAAGQSIVLMLTNGSSYTVTWPTMTWVTATGNAAPTLTASDTLVFWKISTTLYGAYVGSGA